MKLYNTLTRQIEEVKPLKPGHVSVYTCGPTVYDYQHIGNWFNYIRKDILIRALQADGLQSHWVINITDVGHLVSDADDGEDKLEKGARREGKSAWDVAQFYTADFIEVLGILHITTPSHMPRATDHIAEQIALIQTLEEKDYTYVIDDGVYYDTSKFKHYASFARLDLDEQQAGARVSFNQQKRNSSDFALWKFSPKDRSRDMEWESPWGKGFPGWHIECSAMSMKYLGNTIDIHTGGIDHIPVHHTNEIAQSEAATGQRFANHWLHSNHITVNNEKISKSLGNGIRIQEIVAKGIPAEAVRLHVLESHYRSQSKFSWESLEAAANRLHELHAMAALRWQSKQTNSVGTFVLSEVPEQLTALLTNDLSTPQILVVLSQLSTQLLETLVHNNFIDEFEGMLQAIDDLLGLELMEVPNISDQQKAIIVQRDSARSNKDWAESDRLRDELVKQGISLRDTVHGSIWSWSQL